MPQLTRAQYFLASLAVSILPFFAGLGSAIMPEPSIFWFSLSGLIFLIWIIWVIVSTVLKLYEKKLHRIAPIAMIINISGFLFLVPLWRIGDESIILGILLLGSYMSATIFLLKKSKHRFNKQNKNTDISQWLGIAAFGGPILWGIVGFIISGFAAKTFVSLALALVGYIVGLYITAVLIKQIEQAD